MAFDSIVSRWKAAYNLDNTLEGSSEGSSNGSPDESPRQSAEDQRSERAPQLAPQQKAKNDAFIQRMLDDIEAYEVRREAKRRLAVSHIGEDTRRPVLLFLDWDGTLTEKSTIPWILSIGTYPRRSSWEEAVANFYAFDLWKHNRDYPVKPQERTVGWKEYCYLKSLERIERESLKRIQDHRIFEGVSHVRAEGVGAECLDTGRVRLREGWQNLIQHVQTFGRPDAGGETHIISVAWSRTFIRACLVQAWQDDIEEFSLDEEPEIFVTANEFNPGTGSVMGYPTPDGDDRCILTAHDKFKHMARIKANHRERHNNEFMTVYIGDSTTDLICLIQADIGICMLDLKESEEQKTLRETLERLHVRTESIEAYPVYRAESGPGRKKILWLAFNFNDIADCGIFNHPDDPPEAIEKRVAETPDMRELD